MRKNPKKAQLINASLDRLSKYEALAAKGEPVAGEIKAEVSKLVKLCGHNLGLIIPWLFPAYPYDKPLSLVNRPYMFALLSLAGNAIVTFRAGRQIGKCVHADTNLTLKDGKEVTIKDLYDMA